jgi:hypothetical protein
VIGEPGVFAEVTARVLRSLDLTREANGLWQAALDELARSAERGGSCGRALLEESRWKAVAARMRLDNIAGRISRLAAGG